MVKVQPGGMVPEGARFDTYTLTEFVGLDTVEAHIYMMRACLAAFRGAYNRWCMGRMDRAMHGK